MQRRAVVCLNADTRNDREATVLVGQHLFDITTLDQAPPDKGAQDALMQVSAWATTVSSTPRAG